MAIEPPGILTKWLTKQHLLSGVWSHRNYQHTLSSTRITIGYNIRKFCRQDSSVFAPFNRPLHMSHVRICNIQHGFGVSGSRSTQLGLRQCLPKFGISKLTFLLRFLLSVVSQRDEFLCMNRSLWDRNCLAWGKCESN